MSAEAIFTMVLGAVIGYCVGLLHPKRGSMWLPAPPEVEPWTPQVPSLTRIKRDPRLEGVDDTNARRIVLDEIAREYGFADWPKLKQFKMGRTT